MRRTSLLAIRRRLPYNPAMPTTYTSPVLEGLREAMLGTADGGLISEDSEVPAGEMLRLASEYIQRILDSNERLGMLSEAQKVLRAVDEPLSDIESLVPDLTGALSESVIRNHDYTSRVHRTHAEAGEIAALLLKTWQANDPKSGVALHPASYMETFLDMARAVVDEREGRRDGD